jgi:hypothetical protein
MLTTLSVSVLAEDLPLLIRPNFPDIDDTLVETPAFERWQFFTGKITDITPIEVYEDGTVYYHVSIETEDQGVIVFVITPGSIAITEDECTIGDTFTGWIDASRPVIMIWPPQYTAVAYGVNLGITGIKIARFDENFLSLDGELFIRIHESTVVRWAGGDAFEGDTEDLIGLELVVIYHIVALSMPPQTTPSAIYILPEDEAYAWDYDDDTDWAAEWAAEIDWASVSMIVNGESIDAPAPYAKGWMVMVPLRAVAEALGFEVHWVQETHSIMLNNVYTLRIGYEYYYRGRMAPFRIEPAPELSNGFTYVPLSFFREVMGLNNAYFFEGVIEINDFEPMEDDMR